MIDFLNKDISNKNQDIINNKINDLNIEEKNSELNSQKKEYEIDNLINKFEAYKQNEIIIEY